MSGVPRTTLIDGYGLYVPVRDNPQAAGGAAPASGAGSSSSTIQSLESSNDCNCCVKWLRGIWDSTIKCCCPGTTDTISKREAASAPTAALLSELVEPRPPSPSVASMPDAAVVVVAVGLQMPPVTGSTREASPPPAAPALSVRVVEPQPPAAEATQTVAVATGAAAAPAQTAEGPSSAASGKDLIAALGAPLVSNPIAFLATPPSPATVDHINYVIDTSASAKTSSWGAGSLFMHGPKLRSSGAAIGKELHPLEFLAYKLEHKRDQVKDIRSTAVLNFQFVADWAKDLMSRQNLPEYLEAFYTHMRVVAAHKAILNGFVKASPIQWDKFYDHCLHNDLTVDPVNKE